MAKRKKEKSPTGALIDQLLEGRAPGTLFERGSEPSSDIYDCHRGTAWDALRFVSFKSLM